jgi:hypothetical protein
MMGPAACQYHVEQERFIRLYFPEGEIDFIAAPSITALKPTSRQVAGVHANVEDPVEIVAKKMIYRTDEFKPRDVFDLAIVYDRRKADMLKVATLLSPAVEALTKRVDLLESSGQFESRLNGLKLLDGGRKVHGHEL